MADEKDEKAEGEDEAKPKKKSKKLLLIIIIAVAVIAGGGGAFFFLTKSGGEKKTEHKEEKKAEDGIVFALEPFVVNLSDATGVRFLKVTMQIELSKPEFEAKAKAKVPQIRDAVITLLTSKSSDMLVSPEGKLQLKDEINIRLNQVLGEGAVKNVFLTDFIMQ